MKSQIKHLPQTAALYEIRHRDSGKVYVGSSVNVRRRMYCHVNDLERKCHGNAHLQAAVSAYGLSAFLIVCSAFDGTLQELRDAETALIQRRSACDRQFGYNVSPVAGLSVKSPETLAKISAAKRGHKQRAETIAKRALSLRGMKRPPTKPETLVRMADAQRGKRHSDEHKAKIAAAIRGRKHSDEMRKKMSELARNRSPETRAKLATALTGKTPSQETRMKMSLSAKRRYERVHAQQSQGGF